MTPVTQAPDRRMGVINVGTLPCYKWKFCIVMGARRPQPCHLDVPTIACRIWTGPLVCTREAVKLRMSQTVEMKDDATRKSGQKLRI